MAKKSTTEEVNFETLPPFTQEEKKVVEVKSVDPLIVNVIAGKGFKSQEAKSIASAYVPDAKEIKVLEAKYL